RQVDVDQDAAAAAPEVVVEGGPGLIRRLLELDGLAVGQADDRLGTRTKLPLQAGRGGEQLVRGNDLRLGPRRVAGGGRAGARQPRREQLMRRRQFPLRNRLRVDAVAALGLLGPADRLAGETACGRLAAEQLCAQPGFATLVAEVELRGEG